MSIGVILSLVFMVLKLMNYIDWSWFYVAIPALLEAAVSLVVLAFVFMKWSRRDDGR